MYSANFSRLRLSMVFVLMSGFLLSAYKNMESPFLRGNSQNVDSRLEQQDVFFKPTIKSVAIMFLVDVSGSVIGHSDSGVSHCDLGEPPLRKAALNYFLNILDEIPDENSSLIHVGVSTFGSSYKNILPLTGSEKLYQGGALKEQEIYMNLENFLSNNDASFENSTRYSIALQNGSAEIEKYASERKIDHKVLIILSDGFDPNPGDFESALEIIPFDIDIYLAPVCPDKGDLSFWRRHRIPNLGYSQISWVEDVFHKTFIVDVLPEQGGWIDGKINNSDVKIDGSANSVIFSYLPYSEKSSVKINDRSFSGTTLSLEQSPGKFCLPQTYSLEMKSSDRGYWWIDRIDRPLISSVSIVPVDEKLVSNNIGEIIVQITSLNLPKGDLQKWRNCLFDSVDLVFYDENQNEIHPPVLAPQKCEGDNSDDLCPIMYGDGLEKKWKWLPPHLNTPVIIGVSPIYTDKFSGQTIIGSQEKIHVYFKPELISMDKISIPSLFSNDVDKSYFVFDTQFDVLHPNIYLTRSFQDYGVSNACPALNAKWRKQDVHGVPQSENNRLFARVKNINKSGGGKYEVEVNPKALECGFDILIFSWHANSSANVVSSDYVCNLKEERCDLVKGK